MNYKEYYKNINKIRNLTILKSTVPNLHYVHASLHIFFSIKKMKLEKIEDKNSLKTQSTALEAMQ